MFKCALGKCRLEVCLLFMLCVVQNLQNTVPYYLTQM